MEHKGSDNLMANPIYELYEKEVAKNKRLQKRWTK